MLKFPALPTSDAESWLRHPAASLLLKAHPHDRAAEIFDDKVRNRPLLLRPSSPDPQSKDARSSRRLKRLRKKQHYLRKQKPRPLSAKQRRALGVHDIPDDKLSRTWSTYLPLRELWRSYIRDILGIGPSDQSNQVPGRYLTSASAGSKLASADYHGADLLVVRSNCVSRVGIRGIVLKDTKFTFELITPQDELKIVPKALTVFRFEVPRVADASHPEPEALGGEAAQRGNSIQPESALKPLVFEIHGDQFEIRPADRATKKFKPKGTDHL